MALIDRLLFLIDADGRPATNEFNRVARAAKETLSVGQQFGRDFTRGLGLGAGAVSGFVVADAVRRLAAFTLDGARAAEEDARAQIVLGKALEHTASATSEQIRETEDFISATSRATGVVDDELRPAMATLVRSTNDVAAAQRLLTLANDVAVGTGRDLSTTSTALAKTWEGQTTALGRLLPEVGGLVREGASAKDILLQLERGYGGTAKEASAAAGSFGQFNVAVSELQENLGSGLLPAVKGAGGLIEQFRKVMETPFGQKGLIEMIGDLGSTYKLTTAEVEQWQRVTGKTVPLNSTDIANFRDRLDDVANSSSKWSSVLREMGFGASGFNQSLGVTSSSVMALEDSLRSMASVASSAFSKIFGLASAEDRFADALDDTSGAAGGAARATRDLVAEQFALERSARSVLQAELDLLDAEKDLEEVRKGASEREKKRAGLDVTDAQNRVKQAQQRIAQATNELNRATGRRGNPEDAARARQELADAILEEERAREDLIDTQEREIETMRRGTQGSEDLADATKRVGDAQWNLREAIEAQRQSAMQDETDGGPVGRSARQQRDSFREAAEAAGTVIQEMVRAGVPTDVITEKIGEMVKKLEAAGAAAGMTKQEIKEAADLLIAFGALAQAEIQRNLSGIHGFGSFTLKEELDAMRRQGIYVPDIAYQLAGGRAGGGSTNAGSSYAVGERGPEVLTMGNSPGWVTPNSGGGMVVNFNGTVVADKANLERLVFEALQSAQRRGWN